MPPSQANTLVRKLEHFVRLSAEDKSALQLVSSERVRQLGPREDVMRQGEKPRAIYIMLSGWACRYKQLEDGRRQMVAFFLPGDICDLNVFLLKHLDHSIATITPAVVADVTRTVFETMLAKHERIAQAFWWETLVNASIQREWTLNLGQRNAFERVGHLLCELFLRLRSVGLTNGTSCEFPITQADLAEATGLSVVHVNRTLHDLRNRELIAIKDKVLIIPDFDALKQASFFTADYLHLDNEEGRREEGL